MENNINQTELARKKLDLVAKVLLNEEPKKRMLKAFLFFILFSVLSGGAYLFGSEGLSLGLGILALVFIVRVIESYREI